MSARRRTKPRGSVPGHGNPLRKRKEENVLLHDEADLVNFRSDALSRFVSNQEYLENVASKPVHTANIVPPFSFPRHGKRRYAEHASDAELVELVKGLKPDELFTGDRRLMRAKLQQLQQETAALEQERAAIARDSIFSEEMRFQSDAVRRLAAAQASGMGRESTEQLAALLAEVVKEQSGKHGRSEGARRGYVRRSVPLSELAPGVAVEEAPAHYNPRSIMSFIEMKASPGGPMETDFDRLQFRPPGSDFRPPPGGDFRPDADQYKYEKDKDVNMDELNQFLAEPTENIDDMDALMNFDDNDDNMDDFNVEFLSQMDNDLGRG